MKALGLCLNRFDDDTKTSFVDLYTKVDAGASIEEIMAPPEEVIEEPSRPGDTTASSY
jgi:hypothetical protein